MVVPRTVRRIGVQTVSERKSMREGLSATLKRGRMVASYRPNSPNASWVSQRRTMFLAYQAAEAPYGREEQSWVRTSHIDG